VRLLILVEGQTEESFVNEVLSPHLYGRGFSRVAAKLLGNARQRSRRGGIRPWPSVREDILRHLSQDQHQAVTTMVDYYALPKAGGRAWPGRLRADSLSVTNKARCVADAVSEDIRTALEDEVSSGRFLPYVVMHEFEALLFSDCGRFANAIGKSDLESSLRRIRDEFDSPEEINDSPNTAPSKRIESLIPEYEKPLYGTLAALEIGLTRIRSECPGFDAWVSCLETLTNRTS
jgi:Domain of unknown function (DUF4276)